MDSSTVFLPVAFLCMAACLTWVLCKTKGRWFIKAIMTVLTISFSVAVWDAMKEFQGWPTVTVPEGKFELYGVLIVEPNNEPDSGCIYVWVNNKDKASVLASWLRSKKIMKDEPRTFRLPYSREAHETFDGARRDLAKGRRVVGRFGKVKAGISGKGKKDGKDGKGRSGRPSIEYDVQLWYPLPPGGGVKEQHGMQ